jgi:hypothetical protein
MLDFENKITYRISYKMQECVFIPTEQKIYSELPNIIKGHVVYPEEGTYNIEGWFHPVCIYKKEILHQKILSFKE